MKRLTLVSVLLLAFCVSTSALAWDGDWNNLYAFNGGPPEQCPPIAPGSLIQLIHAGVDGQVDDPIATFMAQPDPQAALDAWLLAGTPPVGDDTLRDQTVFQDYGPGFEGYFGISISGNDGELDDPWYTRFFTAAEGEIAECDWYGEVGDPNDPNDPIYELILTGYVEGEYTYGEYSISLDGVCADKHIVVPEPATMAIAGIALLLGFFRKKK